MLPTHFRMIDLWYGRSLVFDTDYYDASLGAVVLSLTQLHMLEIAFEQQVSC